MRSIDRELWEVRTIRYQELRLLEKSSHRSFQSVLEDWREGRNRPSVSREVEDSF